MEENNIKNGFIFYDLKWDTEFFGVTSGKAILYRPLNLQEWNELKIRFKDYQFISIVNQGSEPVNAQMIGKDTSAFLADVNIQFVKKIDGQRETSENITIHQSLDRDDQIINLANFQFSKFIEDPELAKRGGDQVYHQWVANSFNNPNKFFALYKDANNNIVGFLLYSYDDNACVIELIAVSPTNTKSGIGTKLFKTVENAAHQHGCDEIRVGTQLRNFGAINFYYKNGCRQIGCHQVYHLWNV